MEPLKIATCSLRHGITIKCITFLSSGYVPESVGRGSGCSGFSRMLGLWIYVCQGLVSRGIVAIAEPIPTGESTQALIAIAKEFGVTLLAGFFERDGDRIYKAQVCVDSNGLKAKYRKLHPFINPNILPGDQYVVFEIKGLEMWHIDLLR
mgnify:CR=1 FL=1